MDAHRDLLPRNLAHVRARIAAAAARAGRNADDVTLVAVTKSVDAETAAALASLGQLDLGENRVQELERKRSALAPTAPRVRWHLIGPLQDNKVRKAVQFAACIHALDDPSQLPRIARIAEEERRRVAALLEVNVSGEGSKHGVAPQAVLAFLSEAKRFSPLEMLGLMTMAPAGAPEPQLRALFAELRSLRDRARAQALFAPSARFGGELSMGMSGDFEIAVEEGATLVRVGSVLFEGIASGKATA